VAKEPIRLNKTCQNCEQLVEERFCPNCGQENIETRVSFHHIFKHFLEDLTHYDNKFWKSIFYLLLKPASLSIAYINGKRLHFLNPFRLYIFISFITFLTLSLFSNKIGVEISPSPEKKKEQTNVITIDSLHIKDKSIEGLTKIGVISQDNNDTIKKILSGTDKINSEGIVKLGFKKIDKLDSIKKTSSNQLEENTAENWFLNKWESISKEHTAEANINDFSKSFSTNFQKVLFLYMPVFAFILWLFHDRKRWFYFDHGIFTLHYFSFLLLMSLLIFGLNKLEYLASISPVLGWIQFSLKTVAYLYMLYYFFPAHRLFYGDKFILSFFKSSIVFIINIVVFATIMVVFSLYTYLNLE
jgi:hypothetical protein